MLSPVSTPDPTPRSPASPAVSSAASRSRRAVAEERAAYIHRAGSPQPPATRPTAPDSPGAIGPTELRRVGRALYQWCETDRMLGVGFVPPQRPTPFRTGANREPAREVIATGPSAEPPAPSRPVAPPAADATSTPASPPYATRPDADAAADHIPPAPRALVPESTLAASPTGDADMAKVASKPERLTRLQRQHTKNCPHCTAVAGTYTNMVFGEGDPDARLMFIGEAPGEDEDRTGRPFVGRAGQLLEKMITAMGLERQQVYIGNVIKCRPPNNATPTTMEVALCGPYLLEQIRIIQPEVIVALGLPASHFLLQSTLSMARLRGRFHPFEIDGRTIEVMPTYHPAYLLRSYTPENRAKVWSDLQMVMERLGLKAPGKG